MLYVGSKGKMIHSSHGGMPELLPRQLHDEAVKVPKTIKRSPGHYEEWVEACKGGPPPIRISTTPACSRRSYCWVFSRQGSWTKTRVG